MNKSMALFGKKDRKTILLDMKLIFKYITFIICT